MPKDERPLLVVAILIEHQGKFLVAKRIGGKHPGLYGCPGGKVDFGESPIEAIVRETKEETGIELDPFLVSPTGLISSRIYDGERQRICIWFRAQLPLFSTEDITFIEKDKDGNHKTGKWTWMSEAEIKRVPRLPDIIHSISHYKEHFALTNIMHGS